ncbi:MAG: nucleotide exchange factor GrpE [Christensenella sp.]|nr:MAG: nucleotide exchange factor GrpE [Christensenella sp.]
MSKNKNKQNVNEEVETETVETAEQGEVETEQKPDIEIDRDGMNDEQYIAALEQKLGQAIAEANTCKGLTQRLQADFDNYRKRNNSIAEDMKLLGQSIVIEKLLTVLDNCDLARKYIQDQSALTGFNMMENQILTALAGFGLKEVETDGKEFDAKVMQAVERVKDEQNAGKVVEVLAKGYLLNDKLLRPASVKVGYWE